MNNNLGVALNALNEKKAMDLAAIRVGDLTIVAEYFILATATSNTHVKTLADEVEVKLSEMGVEPHHIEGRATGWILLDYADVIVHVYNREMRAFYDLERFWKDGTQVDISEVLEEKK